MIVILFLISALFTGCTDKIRVIGHAPNTSQELIGKNINQLEQEFLIAQDKKDKKQYYLGKMIYKYNTTKATIELLEQKVYQLTANHKGEIVNATLIPISLKQKKLYDSMPKMPDRSTLLSKLFADIGGVMIV